MVGRSLLGVMGDRTVSLVVSPEPPSHYFPPKEELLSSPCPLFRFGN